LSASLWRQSLEGYVANNPGYGVRFQDDFTLDRAANTTTDSSQGGWYALIQGTAATFSVSHDLSNPDGILNVSSTPSATDSGLWIKAGTVAGTGLTFTTPMHATMARGRLVYETRILSRSNATVRPFFAGLILNSRTTSPLLGTSSTMADIGHVGFYIDLVGDLYFTSKATAGSTGTGFVQVKVLDHTDTQLSGLGAIKLGFAINDQPTGVSYDVVVNEVWYRSVARQFTSAAAPTVALTPSYAIASGAASSTAETFAVDSVDVFEASIT
jgi:hypothetical protein